ncbi:hypothetical protein [Amycolatopsis sp. PS_44_ISF1]|uniref:hypothetical protein n=1 Tax=Amycolatopsis sp. PS_44_ISF1 TaxID=2974917 RepID=UPI0028DE139C|nr:hypothetical protein [Amycolatopsis sp. PS_44_ISF1]MDT8911979.1 hypothetical protein [Amycolatopsis sp. PS_44_ISF1]
MPTPAAHPWHTRIDQLHEQASALCAELSSAPIAERLTALAHVDRTFTHLYLDALRDTAIEARSAGWGLRRIGAATGRSHERIRILTTRTRHHPAPGGGATGAGPERGPGARAPGAEPGTGPQPLAQETGGAVPDGVTLARTPGPIGEPPRRTRTKAGASPSRPGPAPEWPVSPRGRA